MKNKILLAGVFVVLGTNLAWSETAVVKLKGTSEASTISGTVTLTDTKEGLKVAAQLSGVPAGDHGFHIHEFGACDDSGKAAGGHYNPKGSKHGNLMKEGIKHAHGGDMGNITAGADGKAALEALLPKVSLTGGKFNVGGRAIVLHEKVDDFTQPVGNAGARIGCGVIGITSAQ